MSGGRGEGGKLQVLAGVVLVFSWERSFGCSKDEFGLLEFALVSAARGFVYVRFGCVRLKFNSIK